MKKCKASGCLLYCSTILVNVLLLFGFLFIFVQAYGPDRYLALLICVVPVLTLLCLCKRGDREERMLKKRIRRAELRKELDELKQYDTSEESSE